MTTIMSYEDFLPEYPMIDDEEFYRRIVEKKEFWTSSSAEETTRRFFQHQVSIARYLSQWTLYDSLFLFHEMGTGKSGVTVALTENMRKLDKNYFWKVIYITQNQTLIDNYKNEVPKFSPRIMKKMEAIEKRSRRIWEEEGYMFFTFHTLASDIQPRTDAGIRDAFNHSIIIVDEAHHLVLSSDSRDRQAYSALDRMLSCLSHKKVLVMTGTPIREEISQIAPLLNLVLPISKRFPSRAEFLSSYFDIDSRVSIMRDRTVPIYKWKPEGKAEFLRRTKGRLSYLRREVANVKTIYVGRIYSPMKSLHIDFNRMVPNNVQNIVYNEAFAKESRAETGGDDDEPSELGEGGIYSNSRQASLFVYPDGSIGNTGFDKYVKSNITLSNEFFNEMFDQYQEYHDYNRDMFRQLYMDTIILPELEKYSTMYAAVIREILAHPDELVYIYNDLVTGSGALLFTALMRSFMVNFELITSAQNLRFDRSTKTGRMIVLHKDVGCKETEFQKLIEYFNDPSNKDGKLCQVIMGTSKTKEGISLKNIRQIHILTPSWNMADMSQAMARGMRARSHDDLEDPTVKMFLHAAIPFQPKTEEEEEWEEWKRPPTQQEWLASVDYTRYFRSEVKERNLKLIERVFLESSWDCMMNLSTHANTGRVHDGSRECEYSSCGYKCVGVDDEDAELGTDVSNMNTFYGGLDRDLLIEHIRHFFRHHSLGTIEDVADGKDLDRIMLEQCLDEVVSTPLLLQDKWRMQKFLSVRNGLYFLIDNPLFPYADDAFSSYYEEKPATHVDFNLPLVLDAFYMNNLENLVPKLVWMINNSPASSSKSFFLSFPPSFQSIFCEVSVLEELSGKDVGFQARQWFMENFPTEFETIPNRFIIQRFSPRGPRQILLSATERYWTDVV